jgi:hypothetical protein
VRNIGRDTHYTGNARQEPEFVKHISAEALERYAMLTLPRRRIRPLEEHLFCCSDCQERLHGEIDFVTAMRRAAKEIVAKKRKVKTVEVRTFTAGHSE